MTSEDKTRLACGIEEVDLLHMERHAERSHEDHWFRGGEWMNCVNFLCHLLTKKERAILGTRWLIDSISVELRETAVCSSLVALFRTSRRDVQSCLSRSYCKVQFRQLCDSLDCCLYPSDDTFGLKYVLKLYTVSTVFIFGTTVSSSSGAGQGHWWEYLPGQPLPCGGE